MAAGGCGAAHQIETDGVIVPAGAIKLKPEHIGRDLGDLFDRGAADGAERVWNAGALRGAGQIQIGARPHDRRAAHRRNTDRRGIAAAEQFDLARRQRRHHAIARHQFHCIERRPVAPDAGIVLARAAIRIFEGKMRQVVTGAAAQIIDGRIAPVKLGITRIGVLAGSLPSPSACGRGLVGAAAWRLPSYRAWRPSGTHIIADRTHAPIAQRDVRIGWIRAPELEMTERRTSEFDRLAVMDETSTLPGCDAADLRYRNAAHAPRQNAPSFSGASVRTIS